MFAEEQHKRRWITEGLATWKNSKGVITALLIIFYFPLFATTKTATTGNWSSPSTWAPSGVPSSTDDVIIPGGKTVTVDGNYTCNNLDFGNSSAGTTGITITTAGNSLTVNGDFRFNPNNKTGTHVVDAGPGAINIAGTFSYWATSGTDKFQLGTGTLSFATGITITATAQSIVFTDAGTVNFYSDFSDAKNKLTVFAGCTVNFYGSYTVTGTNVNWLTNGTANFYGTGTITDTKNIVMNDVHIMPGANVTMQDGGGTFIMKGSLTADSASSVTLNENVEVDGDLTLNGGTFTGAYPLILNGATPNIYSSSPINFGATLQVGATAGTADVTLNMDGNATLAALTLGAAGHSRYVNLNGHTLTVSGDLTINQPTASSQNSMLSIDSGTCTVNGNLIFAGTNNTATRIGSVTSTSGTFNLNGAITWMSNTAVATEVISTATGTINFNSAISMGSQSGTISVTDAGAVNFNSTASPGFSFGGATTPVFTTAPGSTITFYGDVTTATSAISFNAASYTVFPNSITVISGGTESFGYVQVNNGVNLTLQSGGGSFIVQSDLTLGSSSVITMNDNIEVDGNLVDNGGSFAGTGYSLIMNGATSSINGSGSLTLPGLQIGTTTGPADATCTLNRNVTAGSLNISAAAHNRYLYLNGKTLNVTGDATLNQPTANIMYSMLSVDSGTCTVNGNLVFAGINNTVSRICNINTTSGTFTLGGTITWMSNTGTATELINTATGTLNFNSAVNLASQTGTIAVTDSGTVNFNDTSSSSFSFGGATTPVSVFSTVRGSTVNFAGGLTTTSTTLTFDTGSVAKFSNSDSINAGAAVNFGYVQLNNSANVVLQPAGGSVIVKSDLTLNPSSVLTMNDNLEIDGNLVNNGGSFAATSYTLTMNGPASVFGGTSDISLSKLQIGATTGSADVTCTLNRNTTAATLTISSAAHNRYFNMGGKTLTVTGDATLNQPTASSMYSMLSVDSGTCTVNGNLVFAGTSNITTRVCSITATNGTINLNGDITWMANTGTATEVISVGKGTLNFANPINLTSQTGTIAVTDSGTVNFNNTSSSSFSFGGATTPVSVFSTVPGSNINFAGGFATTSTTLTFDTGSVAKFSNSDSINAGAAVNFGYVQLNNSANVVLQPAGGTVIVKSDLTLNPSSVLTLNDNLEVDGNLYNNGGSFTSTTNALIMNGTASNINGSADVSIPVLQIGTTAGAADANCTINRAATIGALNISSAAHNRYLNLAGNTLTVTGDATLNQPTASMNSSLAIDSGTCTINGNLVFTGTNNTTTHVCSVTATSGTFNLNGDVTWMVNTAVATEVISVGTGKLNFANPVNLITKTGTIAVTDTGTINFNSLTTPCFNFGGATAPVLTTSSGSVINFSAGLTATTTALTFNPASTVVFKNTGVVTPTAAITFGNVLVDTNATLTPAGNIAVKGNWTDNGHFVSSTYTVTFNGTGVQDVAAYGEFYNLTINNASSYINLINDLTVNHTLTFSNGLIYTNANKVILASAATTTGGGTGKYIYGNEEIYIPNGAAPARTFNIGDQTTYAPVLLAFSGTTTGSGSIVASTTAGDASDINNSGINSSKSVNRTWSITNNGVGGFTTYAPTFTFVAGDLDAGASTSNFVIRKKYSGTWATTTISTRTATTTRATGLASFGTYQIGEPNTITVATNPTDSIVCTGAATSFTSTSSSVPTPTVKWQRNPNSGVWTDITGTMDGNVYSNYTTTTLNISNSTGLSGYSYRAVFTNINGSATSTAGTLTISLPTVTGTTPATRCDSGSVTLAATPSAGTINWYTVSTGGSSVYSGNSYTVPMSATTTYYAEAASYGCTSASRTAVIATVNTTPAVTGTTPAARCGTGTVNLGAASSAGTINWYAASSGGPSLNAGTAYTTPSLTNTTTYYVDATANSCTSTRTSVTATVNVVPTITGSVTAANCGPAALNLSASADTGTINWYAASTGGASINTGTTYTTPLLSSTTTYYVDATANSCTTAARTAVTATINNIPVASVLYHSCPGIDGSTTIQLSGANGVSPYTYSLDSATFTGNDTMHIANGNTQSYFAKDSNGCISSSVSYTAQNVASLQIATTGDSTTCGCHSFGEGRDLYLTNGNNLIAVINDEGHDIGEVTATVYTRPAPVIVTGNNGLKQAAMSRSFLLHFTGTGLSPEVQVKFPFTDQEFSDLVAASAATPTESDNVTSIGDLGTTQYEGPNEDDVYETSQATMLIHHDPIGNGTLFGSKYIMIGLTANGEDWLNGNNTGSPLPIKLVSFNAAAEGKQVLTSWTTELEINNNYFTVERSADGINFTEVARVQGAGNSTTGNSYSAMDQNPISGISYYRLKQTDFDGNFTYSNIVAVNMDAESNSSVSMYPNPTNGEVNIRLSNVTDNVQLDIYNQAGQLVYNANYPAGNGAANNIKLNIKDVLPSGIYFVNINSNQTSFKEKLVVK